MDVSKAYSAATRTHVPRRRSAMTRSTSCNGSTAPWTRCIRGRHRARTGRDEHRRRWQATRWALRTGENKLTDDKRALVNQIARTNRHIGRAWTLKEQLRDVYRVDHPPGGARQYLRRWITAAKRSRINAFVALAKRLRGLLRGGHRRDRTGHLQRPHRRHQRQDPAHQRPRLRTPLRPNTDLDDLPLPRRTAPQATHNNLRSRTYVRRM